MDWCYMCKKSNESMDQLLLYYGVASVLWDEIFSRTGLACVIPRRVMNLFACWKGVQTNPNFVAIWRMTPLCFIIWLESNYLSLDDQEHSLNELRSFFFHTLSLWDSIIVLDGSSFHGVLISFSSS